MLIISIIIGIIITVLILVILPKKEKSVVDGETTPDNAPDESFVQDPRIEQYVQEIPNYRNLSPAEQVIYKNINSMELKNTKNGKVTGDLIISELIEKIQIMKDSDLHNCSKTLASEELLDLFDPNNVILSPPRLLLFAYISNLLSNYGDDAINANQIIIECEDNLCTSDIESIVNAKIPGDDLFINNSNPNKQTFITRDAVGQQSSPIIFKDQTRITKGSTGNRINPIMYTVSGKQLQQLVTAQFENYYPQMKNESKACKEDKTKESITQTDGGEIYLSLETDTLSINRNSELEMNYQHSRLVNNNRCLYLYDGDYPYPGDNFWPKIKILNHIPDKLQTFDGVFPNDPINGGSGTLTVNEDNILTIVNNNDPNIVSFVYACGKEISEQCKSDDWPKVTFPETARQDMKTNFRNNLQQAQQAARRAASQASQAARAAQAAAAQLPQAARAAPQAGTTQQQTDGGDTVSYTDKIMMSFDNQSYLHLFEGDIMAVSDYVQTTLDDGGTLDMSPYLSSSKKLYKCSGVNAPYCGSGEQSSEWPYVYVNAENIETINQSLYFLTPGAGLRYVAVNRDGKLEIQLIDSDGTVLSSDLVYTCNTAGYPGKNCGSGADNSYWPYFPVQSVITDGIGGSGGPPPPAQTTGAQAPVQTTAPAQAPATTTGGSGDSTVIPTGYCWDNNAQSTIEVQRSDCNSPLRWIEDTSLYSGSDFMYDGSVSMYDSMYGGSFPPLPEKM